LELERRILNKKLVEANGFGEKLSIRIRLLATKF
jgi:hypothetical protein